MYEYVQRGWRRNVMKKYLLSLASVALAVGLVFAVGGSASAHGKGHGGNTTSTVVHGKGHKTGVVATGTTSCNFHGRLTISSSGAVKINGNITHKHGKACTSNG